MEEAPCIRGSSRIDEALKSIKAGSEALKLECKLEIQSEIIIPYVQWECANGMGA